MTALHRVFEVFLAAGNAIRPRLGHDQRQRMEKTAVPAAQTASAIVLIDDLAYCFLRLPDNPRSDEVRICLNERLEVYFGRESADAEKRFCLPAKAFLGNRDVSAIGVTYTLGGALQRHEIIPDRLLPRPELQANLVTVSRRSELVGWAVDRKNPATPIPLLITVDNWQTLALARGAWHGNSEQRFSCSLPNWCSDGKVHRVTVDFPRTSGRTFRSPIFIACSRLGTWLMLSPLRKHQNKWRGTVFEPNAPERNLTVSVLLSNGTTLKSDCELPSLDGYTYLRRNGSYEFELEDADVNQGMFSVSDESGHPLIVGSLSTLAT